MTAVLTAPRAPRVRKPRSDGAQRLLLYDVDWNTYNRLLRALDGRHYLRLTYDQGSLELMTLSYGHETASEFWPRIVVILTMVAGLPIRASGSTTMRRRKKQQGLEPDKCFWITKAHLVLDKDQIDLTKDPPPDLAIEVEVSRSALDRLSIYAALGVPEVWRWDGKTLTFHLLGAKGKYAKSESSGLFPWLRASDLPRFLAMRKQMDGNAVARQFETWVRTQMPSKSRGR